MGGFGETLRHERETRGLTLREVAAETKIGVRYLEALEREELAKLPGSVFNKGYVRTYADFLGISSETLVRAYSEEERSQLEAGMLDESPDVINALSQAIERRRSEDPEPSRRLWLGSVATVVLLGGALAAWLIFRGGNGEITPVNTAQQQPAPTRPAPVEQPRPTETQTPDRASAVEASPEPASPEPAVQTKTAPTRPAAEPLATSTATPPPTTAASTPSTLSIPDFGVGTGVANRQLVGRSDSFPEGSQIWFWTRVLGGKSGDTIRHVWTREGRLIGYKELSVGASHWRTQSNKTLWGTGAWAVEVQDPAGNVLARAEFSCVPAN